MKKLMMVILITTMAYAQDIMKAGVEYECTANNGFEMTVYGHSEDFVQINEIFLQSTKTPGLYKGISKDGSNIVMILRPSKFEFDLFFDGSKYTATCKR